MGCGIGVRKIRWCIRALAEVAVPGRESQLATMLCLLPFGRDEAFRIADAGCGEGVFARAALTAYPMASVLGLDGSASMREHAEALLEPFEERAEVMAFELEGVEWLDASGRRGLFGVLACAASSDC